MENERLAKVETQIDICADQLERIVAKVDRLSTLIIRFSTKFEDAEKRRENIKRMVLKIAAILMSCTAASGCVGKLLGFI